MRRIILLVLVLTFSMAGIWGCGSSEPTDTGPKKLPQGRMPPGPGNK
jgi:hypothetical protein